MKFRIVGSVFVGYLTFIVGSAQAAQARSPLALSQAEISAVLSAGPMIQLLGEKHVSDFKDFITSPELTEKLGSQSFIEKIVSTWHYGYTVTARDTKENSIVADFRSENSNISLTYLANGQAYRFTKHYPIGCEVLALFRYVGGTPVFDGIMGFSAHCL